MFILGISKRKTKRTSSPSSTKLEKRKGGGGRGGGSGGSGGGGKGRGSGAGTSGSSSTRSAGTIGFPAGNPRYVTVYGRGGGTPFPIPAGQPFAGRLVGGGTRDEIYGNRAYGSGYGKHSPMTHRGVSGRPLPFYFWPIVWGGAAIIAGDSYLDATAEYGNVDDNSRPGGMLLKTSFPSRRTNTTFTMITDFLSSNHAIYDIVRTCHSQLGVQENDTAKFEGIPINSPSTPIPKPEQVIQYYRACSIALTLDVYNNSATYATVSEGNEVQDSPLPQSVDMELLTCVNTTIGLDAPLVDGTPGMFMAMPSSLNLAGLALVVFTLLRF